MVPEFDINYIDNMVACYICDDDTLSYLSDLTYDVYGGEGHYYNLECGWGKKEHRMGFRKKVNDGYCYGWLRSTIVQLQSFGGSSYKLLDMAYCTIPGYPLKFGQKDFVDIEENEYNTSGVELFPNPVNDMLTLQLSEGVVCEEINIYSIDGRLLKTQCNDLENIDLSSLSQGIYLVKIKLSDGYIYTEKVVKK